MKIERGSLAVATVGDYIYAIGGGKPNVQYDSVERWDLQPFAYCLSNHAVSQMNLLQGIVPLAMQCRTVVQ